MSRFFNTYPRVLGLILFVMAFFVLIYTTAFAQPTPTINYQGKLTDTSGVAVADGDYNMRFWLLQSTGQATTSAVWTESLTGSDQVTVTNGLFSVMLGSTTALSSVDFNQPLYLGVEIGGTGAPAWDGEMSPRKPLGTVPAAFESFQLGGVASSSFLRSDVADSMDAFLTLTSGASTSDLVVSGTATTTNLVVGTDLISDITGAGLTIIGNALSVSTSTLNINLTDTVGTLAATRGGTGLSTITENQLLIGGAGDTWVQVSTSSLGLSSQTLTLGTDNQIPFMNAGDDDFDYSSNFTFDGSQLTVTGGVNIVDALSANGGLTLNGFALATGSTTANNYFFAGATSTSFASNSNFNFAFGEGALNTLSTFADHNIAVGQNALFGSTTAGMGGDDNVALGRSALANNTSGYDNVAIGGFALTDNISGFHNVAIGRASLANNIGGIHNVALGNASLILNTSGSANVALGRNSLYANTTGSNNVSIGNLAMQDNETGLFNTAIGSDALRNITSGDGNVAIGLSAMDSATDANNSVAVGANALYNNTGTGTIAIGYNAGGYGATSVSRGIVIGDSIEFANSTLDNQLNIGNLLFGTGLDGTGTTLSSGNIGIGTSSPSSKLDVWGDISIDGTTFGSRGPSGSTWFLAGATSTSVTSSAFGNIAIGNDALSDITSGGYNIAIGAGAGANITSALRNILLGDGAGTELTTGTGNIVLGADALSQSNGSDFDNVAIGRFAMNQAFDVSQSLAMGIFAMNESFDVNQAVALGPYALASIANATGSIAIGFRAGDNLLGGDSNIIIGYNVDAPSATADGQLNIGNLLFGTGLDGTGTTLSSGNIGIGTTSPSSKLTVAGDTYIGGALRATGTVRFDALTDGLLLADASGNLSAIATSSLGINTQILTLGTDNQIPFMNTAGDDLEYSSNFTFDGTNLNLGQSNGLAFNGTRFFYASSTNNSIAIGENAGENFNSTTDGMIAIGLEAGRNASSTGFDNIYMGYFSGRDSVGSTNNMIGPFSGQFNSGSLNNFFGDGAGRNNTGSNNSFLGEDTGRLNTGSQNVAFGADAALNNSGSSNTFIGRSAGTKNQGDYNNIVGQFAGFNNTGSYSEFIGFSTAGRMSATYSVAIGGESLRGGSGALGLGNNATTTNNTVIGYGAGYNVLTGGDNNLLLGYQAADSLTTGANNIIIGYDVEAPSNTADGQLNIGNLLFGTGLDGTGTTLSSGNIGIGTSTPSSKLTVAGDTYIGGALRATGTVRFDALTDGLLLADASGNLSAIATSSLGITSQTLTLGTDNQIPFMNTAGDDLEYSSNFTFDGTNLNLGGSNTGLALNGTRMFYASATNENVAIGENAGATFTNNTRNNIAIGSEAGRYASTTNSDQNNFIGALAGQNNTGSDNNILGFTAGRNNTGSDNNLIGDTAGFRNTGSDNNFFGFQSGFNNSGSDNNAFGYHAGYNNSGNQNNLLGFQAGYLSTGSFSNSIGTNAGFNNAGSYSDFIGYESGTVMSASNTVAIGRASLRGGSLPVFFGNAATTNNNTAIGAFAGYSAQTGADNNLFLGYRAGYSLTTGANNIIIGYDVEAPSNTADGQLNIGNLLFGTGVDGTGTTLSSGNIGIGTTSPNAKLTVAGDTFIGGALRATGTVRFDALTSGLLLADASGNLSAIATSSLGINTQILTLGTDNQIPFMNAGNDDLEYSSNFTFNGTNLVLAGTTGVSLGGDVLLSRGAANRLDLATGDSLRLVSGSLQLGTDVSLSRGAANRLDIATGDSVNLVSGNLQVGGTSVVTSGRLVQTANGAAATPAFTFSGDTNTGIFNQAADTLGFTTGGTERMRLNSSNLDLRGVNGNLGLAFNGTRFFYGSSTNQIITIGDGAGENNTQFGLIAIGSGAGRNNTGIYGNLFIGGQDGDGDAVGEFNSGSDNIILGGGSGRFNAGDTNFIAGTEAGDRNTGDGNNLVGFRVGDSNTGSYNNFIGYNAGNNNTGSYSEFIGFEAAARMSASSTVAIGGLALRGGTGSVFSGNNATTTNNTVIGYGAGYNVLTGGDNNLLLGYRAADSLTTGANNIAIGYDVELASNTGSNQLNIGNLIFGTGLDGTGTTLSSGNIGIGTTSPSSKLDVWGDFRVGTGSVPTLFADTSANWVGIGTTSRSTTGTTTERLTIAGGGIIANDPSNPQIVGGVDTAGFTNAVTIAGRYAYVADDDNGLEIIDISDPTTPTIVGGVDTDDFALAVTIAGRYAYVADSSNGLEIIDISDPANPTIVGGVDTAGSALSITIAGRYAYVAGNFSGLEIIDISDPTNPTIVGGVDTAGNAQDVTIVGRYAYVADFANGLEIVDVSNPTAPTILDGVNTDGLSSAVTIAGRYAYVADDDNGLEIIDISDPTNPTIVGGVDTDGNSDSLTIAGRYAYVADGGNGLEIIDISDPTNPTIVGGVDTAGSAQDVTIAGRYAYVADGTNGLQIIDIGGSEFSSLFAGAIGATQVSIDQDLIVGQNTLINSNLNVGNDARIGGLLSIQGYSSSTDTVNQALLSLGGDTDRNSFMSFLGGVSSTTQNVWSAGLNQADGSFRIASSSGLATNSFFTIGAGGNIGIGTSSPMSKLSLQVDTLDGSGVSGIDQYLVTSNSVDAAVQYGNFFNLNASNTATTTIVGSIYRVADNTTFGNTVRGLEVQTNRGSNTNGENTAISGFGRTFGVRGVTSGDAGSIFEPAGGFFETQRQTQGNAIRGYSGTITTASLMSLFQDTSNFSGTGLEMSFGNTTGDFSSTSSKYLDFQNGGSSVFTVSAFGTTTIGDGTTNNMAGLQIGFGGICVDNDGACTASTTGNITAVSYGTANSDLAEMYFSSTDLEPGEIVTLAGGLSIDRAVADSALPILGVVSTKPGLTLGFDDTSLNAGEAPYPVALSGRVPVKLSTENGPIQAGDRLMLSSLPGIAMKATGTGATIGIALEDFNTNRMYSDTYLNQFGDDMVDPVYDPITTNTDSRINDGCYYGGGSATGEAECVPLTSTTTQGQIVEANNRLEAESVADQIADLRRERADTKTLSDGTTVQVGQVVMFVENQYRWVGDAELATLEALVSGESLAEPAEDETLLDRLIALADSFVDGVLSVLTLRADRVETDELCIDGVCVTAEDLRTMLEGQTAVAEPQVEVEVRVDPEPQESSDRTPTEPVATTTDPVVDTATSTEPVATLPVEPEPVATSTEPVVTEEEEEVVEEVVVEPEVIEEVVVEVIEEVVVEAPVAESEVTQEVVEVVDTVMP